MKYSIIIPCYNEKDNIDSLIEQIIPLQDEYDLEYILIENGSVDGSKEYFEKHIDGKYANIKIVYVSQNRGYGYGIQEGIKASSGDFVGWIHADMQIPPSVLKTFFDSVEETTPGKNIFLKGLRTNRSVGDRLFTKLQSMFDTCLFKHKLHDIGAIPVLFSYDLLEKFNIDDMPNDFSIELFVYEAAVKNNFDVLRHKVVLSSRENGNSSWNQGFRSKIRQSKVIFSDSLKIKEGEKVQ